MRVSTRPVQDRHVYGEPVDVDAFLQRPLVARVATDGPTLRPLWYLYEQPTFYWLTDTANFLHRAVLAGRPLVLVVDVCDIETGEVIHVRARGGGEIVPVDRDRAMKKFAPLPRARFVEVGSALRLVARSTEHAAVSLQPLIDRGR